MPRFEIETDEPELWWALAVQMRERRHKLRLRRGAAWTIEHPLCERAAGTLFSCPAHEWREYLEDPLPPPGDYWLELVPGDPELDLSDYECFLTPIEYGVVA